MRAGLILGVLLPCAAAYAQGESVRRGEPREVRIPMRDGASLAADVYLPARPGRHPAVLVQTPYDRRRFGGPLTGVVREGGEAGRGSVSDALALLDRDHYAYVVVDWRGFHGSRDAKVPRGAWRRGLDGYDCVEWVAAQEWCDGKVGTWGGSALGKQQLDTAAERPPHLVCCVPLIASMGQAYESYYEGGVPLEAHVRTLDLLGFGVSALVLRAPLPDQPVWRFAKRRTYRPEAIGVPCLFITGWWDHFPDQVIATFEDVLQRGGPGAAESRLLIGPWDHVSVGLAKQGDLSFPGAALESARAAKAFLDFWLRGEKDNGWRKAPRVRYWRIGADGWQAAAAWAGLPRDVTRLHADGTRSLRPQPPGEAAELRWTYDPRKPPPTLGGSNLPPLPHGPRDQAALGARDDGVVLSAGRLEAPLVLEGNASLTFTFRCDRPDCDFVAQLCDAPPGGGAFPVAEGAIRARLRHGRAEPLEPGAPVRLTLRFRATAAEIPAGHELRLYLASGGWPRYGRNPHTGADAWDEAAARPVTVTLVISREEPVVLELPRIRE